MRRALGKFGATTLATLALVAGLVVLAPAARAALPRWDCAAPAQSDCTAFFGPTFTTLLNQDKYTNTTNATQSATTATYFKCVAATCTTTQNSPTNTASVNNTTNAVSSSTADTTQKVEVHQFGSANTINATLSTCQSTAADCASGSVLTTQSSVQKARQRFITTQEGPTAGSNAQTNNLTLNGTINSRANTQLLNVALPISAEQQSLQYTDNLMRAGVNNTANYTLNRTQNESVTGATPTLNQDTTKVSGDTGPGQSGRAHIILTAPSAGTNAVKIRTNDTKSQSANSIVGNVTATQGYQATQADRSDADGLRTELHVDSANANCNTTDPTQCPDIDMGNPNGAPGIVENWTQNGSAGTYNQYDDAIRIPILGGKSPKWFICNGDFSTTTVANGHGTIRAGVYGETDNGILCKGKGTATAGTKVLTNTFLISSPSSATEFQCDVNTDQCPGGTQKPVSEARQSIRNASENGTFGGSATAYSGQTVELSQTFDNDGGGAATNATMSALIPAGTTLGACADCTPGSGSVSWNLGTVGANTEVTKTFTVTVNNGTGSSTSNATGDDDQEAPFTSSPDTTLNRVAAPTLTVKIKIYPANAGGSGGTTPVAMLSQADDGNAATLDNALEINPSTVCFAKTVAAAQAKTPPCGSVQTTGDVNGDGRPDLKMAFNTLQSGVTPFDKTACIWGQTFSGRNVQGCGPTK